MTEEDGPNSAPATGTNDPHATDLSPAEEPVVTGTLFLTFLLLVVIGGVWVVMYRLLLTR
jgi:hypothetical protein